MSPPKKLTHLEKMTKKNEQEVAKLVAELRNIYKMTRLNGDVDTLRWSALETFRMLQMMDAKSPSAKTKHAKQFALSFAREAQGAMNFGH